MPSETEPAEPGSAENGPPETEPAENGRLYFRQLLSGRDFATDDQMAAQMVNFSYLIGDRVTREAVVVDPAYDVAGLLEIAAADDMKITGVLATHYHADHVGGDMMGHKIEGVAELLELAGLKIHVQAPEAEYVLKTTAISAGDLAKHDPGDKLMVGEIPIELIHTPGHTPGSQCFLVGVGAGAQGASTGAGALLVAGDTLFLEGCGRTDLPGSDPAAMYHTLHHTLARLPGDTVLFPGHRYSFHSSSTLEITRETNYVFKPESEAQWLTMFSQ